MHILHHKIHIMFVLYWKVDQFILNIIWSKVWMDVKMISAYFVGGGILKLDSNLQKRDEFIYILINTYAYQ